MGIGVFYIKVAKIECSHSIGVLTKRLIPFGHEKTKRLGLPYGKYEYSKVRG